MGLLGLTSTGISSMVGAGINVIPFMIQRNVPGIGPNVLPANTLVRAEFVAEQCLVEMEADAEVIRKEQNTGH